MNEILETYECDNQEELNEWLWDIGYYMPLPEKEVEKINGIEKTITWISPEDKMPKDYEEVLIIVSGKSKNTTFTDVLLTGSHDSYGWFIDAYPDMEDICVKYYAFIDIPDDVKH